MGFHNNIFKRILKLASVALAAACITFTAYASSAYDIKRVNNKSGASYIYIHNNTPRSLYCYIEGKDGNVYFQDFFVSPRSDSRRYVEPSGEYDVSCK